MEYLGSSLTELPWFFAHMGTAIGLTLVYITIYIWVTPHAEIALIRENNMAASVPTCSMGMMVISETSSGVSQRSKKEYFSLNTL